MDNEEVYVDGIDISECEYACNTAFGKNGCKHPMMKNIYCSKNPNCYFKQLARKTQECEQIKEKYEALKLENQEGYEIVAELKHECEELEKQLETSEEWRIKAESLNEKLELRNTCYRKALEEIERYINNQGIDNKWNMRIQRFRSGILDIINKAKGR